MCLLGPSLLKTLVCTKWWFFHVPMYVIHSPSCSKQQHLTFHYENSSFFLIWVCIAPSLCFFFSFIQESRGYFFLFFLSRDSAASGRVLSCIRIRASPFQGATWYRSKPHRRKHEHLLVKRSGFESKFHLISFLRKISLMICTKIWHKADVHRCYFLFLYFFGHTWFLIYIFGSIST